MSQSSRIRELFTDHPLRWIPLYEIMDMKPRIANYTMRISELRKTGMEIRNKSVVIDEVVHSAYMYVPFEYKNDQGEFI